MLRVGTDGKSKQVREKPERTRDFIRKKRSLPRALFQQNQQIVHEDSVSVASLSLKFTLVYIGLLILFHLQENTRKRFYKMDDKYLYQLPHQTQLFLYVIFLKFIEVDTTREADAFQ